MPADPMDVTSRSRREFLTSAVSGLGLAALGAALTESGPLSPARAGATDLAAVNPLAPKAPHFAPRAKSCIFIFMEGAPSTPWWKYTAERKQHLAERGAAKGKNKR